MDFFSSFDAPPAKKGKQPSAKQSSGGYTRLSGLVVSVREKSVLFFDDGTGREAFLPVQKIQDWWFSSCGTKRGLRLSDLELDDEITVLVPTWLAKRERLA